MVRNPHFLYFHCRGPGFDPWLGNQDPASFNMWQKKKKEEKKFYNIMHLYYHAFIMQLIYNIMKYQLQESTVSV